MQAAAAIRALLGNCTKWAERADGSCPLSCKLWDVPGGHPEQMRLDKCARCSEGGNHPIRCLRCRWGYAHMRYDFMRQVRRGCPNPAAAPAVLRDARASVLASVCAWLAWVQRRRGVPSLLLRGPAGWEQHAEPATASALQAAGMLRSRA